MWQENCIVIKKCYGLVKAVVKASLFWLEELTINDQKY